MTNQLDLTKLNSFIDSATAAIACGPDCQENKKAEQLKNTYLNAQSNLLLAEPQYQVAKQNYFTFVNGEGRYAEMLKDEMQKKAAIISDQYKKTFNEEVDKINIQLDTYDGLEVNYKNVVELNHKYKKENKRLFEKLKEESNDITTNERKTYYEEQQIESLNTYYSYLFWFIYAISVLCFIIFSLIYPTQTSFKVRIFLVIVFILLPFISTWILGKFIQLMYWLFSLLPKNVYK